MVGIFWTSWEFWKFARGVGKNPRERIYGLHLGPLRTVLLALLVLLLVIELTLVSAADLSPAFLVYAIAIAVLTAAAIVVYPGDEVREKPQPWWAGLAVPNAITIGLIGQLLLFL